MKTLKRRLSMTSLIVAITVFGSLLMTNNILIYKAAAQTVNNTNGGPQDGGDGKKKPKCRPPRCPAVPTTNPGSNNFTETSQNDEIIEANSTDWWDDLVEWFFGD